MNNNYYYFEGCEHEKMQWVSIFLQCYLAGIKSEINEQKLFTKTNLAWYNINKTDPLTYNEFYSVLQKIIHYKMVFKLSISPSKKLFSLIKQYLLPPKLI